MLKSTLSYDGVVIQWIKSCHKKRMNASVTILWRVLVDAFVVLRPR